LITGATGFVGGHLVRRLLAADWDVHAIVRADSREPARTVTNIERHEHDGTIESMIAVLERVRPEVVVHLASLFLSDHEPADVDGLIRSNLAFGTQLLEAMYRTGVRDIVNTGTAWQHYESRDYSPVNLYAATKQAFEAILQYYVEAHSLRAITLTLHDTYGPGDTRRKLVSLLSKIAVEPHPLAMSAGEQQIELVHVDDVTRAYTIAADRLRAGVVAGHEKYVVASEAPRKLREVVEIFERVAGTKLPIDWGVRPYRSREVMVPWVGGHRLPGWLPEIDLATGFSGLLHGQD
jgi:nucleoside-diphosphate-sugar epimerase